MELLYKLEIWLAGLFNKNVPKLPESGRKALADILWVLALIFGILQLWATWVFWYAGHHLENVISTTNAFFGAYGYANVTPELGFMYYLSLAVLLIDAVLLLIAAPRLKERKKVGGWDLLFYGLILNVVYGVVRAFSNIDGGFGAFLFAVLCSAVGAYLLFQVRDNFMMSKRKK